MKALKFFIWTLNLLLLAYLGFTFSGTALMKRKDVAQVEYPESPVKLLLNSSISISKTTSPLSWAKLKSVQSTK